jgi:DNA invertase Pin-like site-specific DNA recombinase
LPATIIPNIIGSLRSSILTLIDALSYPDCRATVATWEREIMLERQREGIARAKSEGKYRGRPASIDAFEVKRVARLVGPTAAAKQLGIARSTVYRLLDQTTARVQH